MIKLSINHTEIVTSHLETLVVGNVNSIFIEFSFSPEWEALEKVAVFSNGTSKISLSLSADTCAIPWEVLSCTGELLVSLRGVGDGGEFVLCAENASLGKVEESLADDDADNPESATPDVVDTLLADVAELKTRGLGGVISKTDLASDVQTSLGKADTALQSVPNIYRTASAQDAIDNGKVDKVSGKELSSNDYTDADKAKVASAVQPDDLDDYAKTEDVPTKTSDIVNDSGFLTDAPSDNKQYARKNGTWAEVVGSGGVETTPIYISWASDSDAGQISLISLTGTAVSVADFISALQSGNKIEVAANHDGDNDSSGYSNYCYKIDGTQAYLAFDVAQTGLGNNRTIIISGSNSGFMSAYQNQAHTDLPDYSPLPSGGGGGGIEDVTVNGESVVTDGIAEIDLTDYALKTDLTQFVKIEQGEEEAGKFLVVGDDGNVTTKTLEAWEGGMY